MPTNNRVEDLVYMATALEQALTQGVEKWSLDVEARSLWLNSDPTARHVFCGTMLVGLFAYAEGRLGRFWWVQLRSAAMRRDLPILWKARNAFVHQDSRLEVNSHNSQQDIDDFKNYCEMLERREIKDDHDNAFPQYLTLSGTELRFSESSFHVFRSIFVTAFNAERLGRIPN